MQARCTVCWALYPRYKKSRYCSKWCREIGNHITMLRSHARRLNEMIDGYVAEHGSEPSNFRTLLGKGYDVNPPKGGP